MAKKVQFEGKTYNFPDDATDQEISDALHAATRHTAGEGPTGQRLKSGEDLTTGPVAFPGLARAGEQPGIFDAAMSGLGDELKHIGLATLPTLAGPLWANPVPTLAGMAGGTAMGIGARALGSEVGMPGTGEVVGDLLGPYFGSRVTPSASRMEIPDLPDLPFMPGSGKWMKLATSKYGMGTPIIPPVPAKHGTGAEGQWAAGLGFGPDLPLRPKPAWNSFTIPERNDYTPLGPITPASGALPSGRMVGPIPKAEPGAAIPPRPRAPLWEGIQITPRQSYAPIEPIAGELPSGRVPGTGVPKVTAAQPATSPIAGSQVKPEIPNVQVPQGAQPTITPEEAMKLETAERTRLNRAIHARAQEMELPNAPAGTKAPSGYLSGLAKQIYGKDYARMSVAELNDFIENHLPKLAVPPKK